MTKKKRMTAHELMAQLNADPQWVEMRRRKDAEFAQRDRELSIAEAPLVAELVAAGFAVTSVWDFVNTGTPYPKAIPILLAHVTRDYPPRIREGIARALAVPGAIFAWTELIRLFKKEENEDVKDGLACAISGAANEDVLDDVIALARDTRLGSSRSLLLSVLENSKEPRARAALMALGSDPQLAPEVQEIFKRQANRKKRQQARRSPT